MEGERAREGDEMRGGSCADLWGGGRHVVGGVFLETKR